MFQIIFDRKCVASGISFLNERKNKISAFKERVSRDDVVSGMREREKSTYTACQVRMNEGLKPESNSTSP